VKFPMPDQPRDPGLAPCLGRARSGPLPGGASRRRTQIWLLAARHLARGHYTLALTTQHGNRKVTTRTPVTIT